MPKLVLKVDVDTWRGTQEGVRALCKLFERYQAPASFLFSLGPDHTGRAIKRIFNPGFFSKISRTSVIGHYGFKTLLYGTLLPGPDIGIREKHRLRSVKTAGFETGIHCWDHIAWQDQVRYQTADWTRHHMNLAQRRYEQIFDAPSATYGAAGWQMNDSALQWLDQQGIRYTSNSRGHAPFRPIVQGQTLRHVELPTNLPTLDELIGLHGIQSDQVHHTLLDITKEPDNSQYPDHSFVYTLHAELEGMKLLHVMEKLLQGWKAQGYEFSDMQQMYYALDHTVPPGHLGWATMAGRSGELLSQV